MTWVLLALSVAGAKTSEPASAQPGFAVSSGRVEGVVTGVPTGLALANVSVTLRAAQPEAMPPAAPSGDAQADSALVRTTAEDGTFRFSDVPAGVYSLEAQQDGYASLRVQSVLVLPGLSVSEHLQLVPRPASARPGT